MNVGADYALAVVLLLLLIAGLARILEWLGLLREPVAPGSLLLGERLPETPGESIGAPRVYLSPEDRRRHVYLLGATGCGKTTLLLRLLDTDIASGRTCVVVDLRGDLVDHVLARLAAVGWSGDLLLMDLRERGCAVPFNPLAGEGDPFHNAVHLLSLVRKQAESWGVQLDETLRNALVALSASGWSLLELEPLLADSAFRAQVLGRVSDSYVRRFFRRYDELPAAQQLAWRLPVLNKAAPLLAVPQLRHTFGQRECVPFRQLLDERPGSVVLFALDVARLHDCAYLAGGILVSALQNAIMARANRPEASRVPVSLYVDEFETMATEQFEQLIAEGRRMGLSLTLSHQNLSQVPARLRECLRNNVHTHFYFQSGATDASQLARELASERPVASLRSSLMSQKMGEAYLVRRGQASVPVRLSYQRPPEDNPAAIKALRAAALSRFARPVAQIEEELREREETRDAAPEPFRRTVAPVFEIRHDKVSPFTRRSR